MKIKESIIWLFRASKGMRLHIILSIFMGLISIATSLMFVWLSKEIVDVATSKSGELQPYIFAIIATLATQLIFSTLNGRLDTINSIKLTNRLRYRLFVSVMDSKLSDRESMHTGDILNRMVEDVRVVADALCSNIPKVIIAGLQLLSAFLFMLMLEAKLAWILLCIMPIAFVISKFFIPKMRKLTGDIRDTDSELHSFMQESVQHSAVIRSLEHKSTTNNKLSTLLDKSMLQNVRRTNFTFTTNTVVQIGFTAGYLTAFIWGVSGLYTEAITFGIMTAFLQLVGQIQRPAVDLGQRFGILVRAITSIDRLSNIDMLPKEELGSAISLSGEIGLEFKDVSFGYPDKNRLVINNFSHVFAPNSCTAIMGETGAGKSTTIKLILSLITPKSGEIHLFNNSTRVKVTPRTRCNFVYVPQGNTLMSGSIRDNLLMGNPNATDDEIREVLHSAVADFVYELPDGLNSMCGERGIGLSEGQAQRIAIARGLLRPGAIMLLDEPTSALDSETERLFLERIKEQKRTIIMVTHRQLDMSFEKIVLKRG